MKRRDVMHATIRRAHRPVSLPFPSFLQILKSNKWGFTNWDREDYVRGRLDGTLIGDGVGVKYVPQHGPLGKKAGT
jgi:large subunit ribosomal protein L10e